LKLRDGSRGTRSVALDYSHTAHQQSNAEYVAPAARPPTSRPPLRAPAPSPDNDHYGDWHCAQVFMLACTRYYEYFR